MDRSLFFRKVKSFASVPWSTKLMFFEAFFTSAYVKTTLIFLPFAKVAKWLGHFQPQPADIIIPDSTELIKNVRSAVHLCAKYTPWPMECYTSSLTAKIMLKRRKIASILYFGFCKDEKNGLKGHAWVRCSEMIVTGGGRLSQYQVHSSFS